MTPPALVLRGVSKTFGDQRALQDASLSIAEGEVHALVGENGSGKSTLIKVLSGFHQPDPGGEVLVAGVPLKLGSPEESRRVGLRFVHQDLGLIEEFSTIENFGLIGGFPRGPLGINWQPLRAIATETLARVGVTLDLDAPVSTLTAVERTALAIARCLDDSELGAPQLLVLDEPTAALPAADVARLFKIVREVAARGVAVMYVSHRLDEVTELCSGITALRDGRVVASTTTEGMDRGSLAELIVGQHIADAAERRPAPSGQIPSVRIRGLRSTTLGSFDLDLAPGEIVGVAGLDGSGRETLATALYGDAQGSADEVVIAEQPLTELSPSAAIEAGIALILANRERGAAVRGMSLAENITMAGLDTLTRFGVINRQAERARVSWWMDQLDIRPRDSSRDYATLSGGNRQKVIFAKWLELGPRLLVMDDPTSGVDIGARRMMYEQVASVAASGTPVLVASSDLEDLTQLCDRVLVLVDGHVTEQLQGTEISEQRIIVAMSPESRQ